jgi:hypothetical protein
MTTKTITVGRFTATVDGAALSIEGPADYLASAQYRACMRRMETGQSAVFNYGLSQGQDMNTLILVTLQTDYAGFKGIEQMCGQAVRS